MLNIDRVIQFLEFESSQLGVDFNMSMWLKPSFASKNAACGTAACIGGTCELLQSLAPDGTYNPDFRDENNFEADEWIIEGLPEAPSPASIFYKLFHPCSEEGIGYSYHVPPNDPRHITREHAIACLKHLRDTGEIDWEGTKPC